MPGSQLDRHTFLSRSLEAPESANPLPFLSLPTGADPLAIDLEPGKTLDRFIIEKQIGRGRTGTVYLAQDTNSKLQVAIKVIGVRPEEPSEAAIELARERAAHNRVRDLRYVIRAYEIFDARLDGLSLKILSMEYAGGGTFCDVIGKRRRQELSLNDAIDQFKGICRCVKAVHDVGLIILDIKPEHFVLTDEGFKIVDLGKAIDPTEPLTLQRVTQGTPVYMCAQQSEPRRPEDVGYHCDVYGLGVMFYELLSSSVPFHGEGDALIRKHRSARPAPLNGEAAPWWPVIRRCLAKSEEDRYATVAELIRDIGRVCADLTPSAAASCPKCGHVNGNSRREDCERCRAGLSKLFRPCPRCSRRNRVDKDECEGCGEAVGIYFLQQERKAKVVKFKDEDPVTAIDLLERMLRDGAGDDEATLIKDLRARQDQIQPWIAQAGEAAVAGRLEDAIALWQKVLGVVSQHRLALPESKRLERTLREFDQARNRALAIIPQGRFQEAETLLEKCLTLVPGRDPIGSLLSETRARHQRYNSLFGEASFSAKRRLLHTARRHVIDALELAPESREALALQEVLSQTTARTEKLLQQARARLGQGLFKEAQCFIDKVEKLQLEGDDLAECKKLLAAKRDAYRQAMSNAQEACQRRGLGRAEQEAVKALQLSPECPDAQSLLEEIRGMKAQARQLISLGRDSIPSADFEVAREHLRHARRIWPGAPGLKKCCDEVERTHDTFLRIMKEAQDAVAQRDLDRAVESAQSALDVCPQAKSPPELVAAVEKDQAVAKNYVDRAHELRQAARFDRAYLSLDHAHRLWATMPHISRAKEDLASAQAHYRRHLRRGRRMFRKNRLTEARESCSLALNLCPKSRAAHKLIESVVEHEDAARECVATAYELCQQASFQAAVEQLDQAAELWSRSGEVDTARKKIISVKSRYEPKICSAQTEYDEKRFWAAERACKAAIRVCPKSSRAKGLRRASRDAQRTYSPTYSVSSVGEQPHAVESQDVLAAMMMCMGVGAYIALCGFLCFYLMGTTTWDWLIDHFLVLVFLNVCIVVVTSIVHSQKYTNSYDELFSKVDLYLDDGIETMIGIGVFLALVTACVAAIMTTFILLLSSGIKVPDMTIEQRITLGFLVWSLIQCVPLVGSVFFDES